MLSTLVILALQHSQRVFWFSFNHWLRTPWFFQGVGRGWTFLSFLPKKLFSFSPGRWFEILLSLVPGQGFLNFFLVPWILVDIRLVYIYIYIYVCVCVCMCVLLKWYINAQIYTKLHLCMTIWFLFLSNGIWIFAGYLMLKLSLLSNSSDTILLIARDIRAAYWPLTEPSLRDFFVVYSTCLNKLTTRKQAIRGCKQIAWITNW